MKRLSQSATSALRSPGDSAAVCAEQFSKSFGSLVGHQGPVNHDARTRAPQADKVTTAPIVGFGLTQYSHEIWQTKSSFIRNVAIIPVKLVQTQAIASFGRSQS